MAPKTNRLRDDALALRSHTELSSNTRDGTSADWAIFTRAALYRGSNTFGANRSANPSNIWSARAADRRVSLHPAEPAAKASPTARRREGRIRAKQRANARGR